MRILILGAGALGGYFGARLLAAGQDVTFLVRPRSAQQLADHGLRLFSPKGDVLIEHPPVVLAEDLHEPFDLILLSCKAYDLDGAMDSIAPAVGPDTAILPFLNGMAHMPALDRRFGAWHVLGSATPISAVREPDGAIRHLNGIDRLYYGDRFDPASARMKRIEAAFGTANFESHLRPSIQQDMWDKWVRIASGAGMTCLMRAAVGDIAAAGGAPLVRQLVAECASIAGAEGFAQTPQSTDGLIAFLTQAGSLFTTSMLRDIEAGAPIEARQILGDLLEHGQRRQLATPLLQIAHTHLRCYEERRLREGSAKG